MTTATTLAPAHHASAHTFEAVSAGAHDKRTALLSLCTVVKGGHIVAQGLQSIKQVIQVLDLRDRPQSAQRQSHALPHDRKFANAGIEYPVRSVFGLEAGKALVYIADKTEVFTKCKNFWIAGK